MKTNYVFLALYFVTPKRTPTCHIPSNLNLTTSSLVFLNSLLGTLNARKSLRENLHSGMVSIPLSEALSTRTGARQDYSHGSGENQASLVLDISASNIVKQTTPTNSSMSRFRSREQRTWRLIQRWCMSQIRGRCASLDILYESDSLTLLYFVHV